jgi:signal transduction histidine kinase
LQSQSPSTAGVLTASLNLSSDGIIVFEPVLDNNGEPIDMRLELMNDAAIKIFGIPREVGVGQLLTKIWNVEPGDPVFDNAKRVLTTRAPIQYELHTDNLGERRWFEINLQPFGETGLAAMYHETTEKRRYIEELEKQKAFYEELIRQSPTRKTVLRPLRNEAGEIEDFLCEYVNYGPGIDDQHRNLSPFEKSLAGQKLSEGLPHYKETPVWDMCCRVATTGVTESQEVHYTADGKNTLAMLTTQRLPDDRLYVSTIDISESRRLTKQLEQEREQLAAVLVEIPLGITVFEAVRDEQGELNDLRLVRRNEKALSLSRISAEIYQPGKLLSELMPKELYEQNFESMLQVVHTGEPLIHELYQPHLDKWISSRVIKYGDGLLSTIQDITAIKRQGEEIKQQADLLNAVLDASPVAVVVYRSIHNAEGAIEDFQPVIANRHALEVAGHTLESFMALTFADRVPDKDARIPELVEVVQARKPRHYEHLIPSTGRWVHSVVTPFGDGFISTAQDITEQKQASQKIEESAHLLNAVLNASPVSVAVYRAVRNEAGAIEDFQPFMANKHSLEITGESSESFFSKTLFQRRPDKEGIEILVDVVKNRREQRHEHLIAHTGRWVLAVTTPFEDGFIATSQDITEQKQATQRIEESNRLLNAVLDASPISIVVYEALRGEDGSIRDFRPMIANRKAMELSNFTPEEFLKKTFFERFPGSREAMLPELSEVVETKTPRNFEWQIPTTGYWVNSASTPFGDGFIATSLDITEQKRQSAQIEEQAQLFHGVLDSLQNGLSILQIVRDEAGALTDLEYLAVSQSVEHDTLRKRNEIIGKKITELFPGIQSTEYWKAYNEVAATGKPVSFEAHFTLHGYDNYLVNFVSPIGDDKLVSVYYIINDLKQAQRELEHTVHELRRSNEDLEQFASIASHDLQEPLRKVESFGAMLETRYAEALGDHGRDLLQRMQNAASRMRNLVSGLLAFARLSGDENVPLEPVDLNSLIDDISADLDETIKSVDGRVEITSRLPFVQGLDGQLRHLFYNLMTNALKFSREDVKPVIEISHNQLHPGDEKRLSPLVRKDDYVRIEVSDNGIGFEPEFSEKIFGLFERLHGVSQYKGTGLGLSICRRVAERHEGAIWAESQLGQGAKFIVLLKLAP